MAFTVAPTAGDGPYLFSATFSEANYIDNVHFGVEYRSLTNSGSCPTDGMAGPNTQNVANALLTAGTYSGSANVPAGSCRASTLLIRNLISNAVVSAMTVTIDNV